MSFHVAVVEPGRDRKSWRLRYVDPDGRSHWRSSKTTNKRKAEAMATLWEAELASGASPVRCNVRWEVFRKRFEDEALPGMAEKSRRAYITVLNHVERLSSVRKLSNLTTSVLSAFVASLRDEKLSENSIKSYLGHVQGFLGWAKQVRLLAKVPDMPIIHRAAKSDDKSMKGRPITDDEFQQMLDAVPGVVGEMAAASWKYWLEGLWWSGLRLAESLRLHWKRRDQLCIDLSGNHPMLRVRAELEKGNRDRLLPLAPEFCEHLLKTPEQQRNEWVFRLLPVKGGRQSPHPGDVDPEWAGAICRRIGKVAGIVVDTDHAGRVKYASAHDLRRAFGTRWASRVRPIVLMQLMRHVDIKTTMKYYVDLDAHATSDAIWAVVRQSGGEVAKCSVSCSVSGKAGNRARRDKTRNSSSSKRL